MNFLSVARAGRLDSGGRVEYNRVVRVADKNRLERLQTALEAAS
jgi:hypothetical protein